MDHKDIDAAAKAAAQTRDVRIVYELEAVIPVAAGIPDEMVRQMVFDKVCIASSLASRTRRIDVTTFPTKLVGVPS